MCPHIEISFNSITKRHNLKQTKVLRGQPVNSNQIFCPCRSFTYDYCLLFGVAGREVKAVRADGECTTRLMRHMQHVCLHFRLLLMRTDLHPTYILYMLELSLKRLDILLDCSKDHRQDIAPWLDCPEIYAHMLSTDNRGVVPWTRGCLLTPGRLSFPTSVWFAFLRFSLVSCFSPALAFPRFSDCLFPPN